MKALLLSAYDAHSHRHWCDSLERMFPAWQWTRLTLPARHFGWRVRGNPLYWSQAERETLEQPFDLLIATSMVDLATLRGLVPTLAAVPSVLYFHENQFDYPARPQQSSLLEAQMVSLYAALAADRLVFNSRYNHDSFLNGCRTLLQKLPDFVPPAIAEQLAAKSHVIPVPVSVAPRQPGEHAGYTVGDTVPTRKLRLLWLGRFEYDKGANGLLVFLRHLESTAVEYELAIIGQQFRDSPPEFGHIESQFSHRLVQFGYLPDPASYYRWLRAADIVVSTANHEFQGLAILEAVVSGCLPLVPRRLAYPEIYPPQFCYPSEQEDPEREAAGAVKRLQALAEGLAEGRIRPPTMEAFSPDTVQPAYASLFTALAG